jgi:hypothetical protein
VEEEEGEAREEEVEAQDEGTAGPTRAGLPKQQQPQPPASGAEEEEEEEEVVWAPCVGTQCGAPSVCT